MDSKKVIEKLVKIAESQQKIINKLAQTLAAPPAPAGTAPSGVGPDLTAVKSGIVKHLVQVGVPQSNAQQFVVKKLDSLTLAGGVLHGEIPVGMKDPQALKTKLLRAIEDACSELGLKSNVILAAR